MNQRVCVYRYSLRQMTIISSFCENDEPSHTPQHVAQIYTQATNSLQLRTLCSLMSLKHDGTALTRPLTLSMGSR